MIFEISNLNFEKVPLKYFLYFESLFHFELLSLYFELSIDELKLMKIIINLDFYLYFE